MIDLDALKSVQERIEAARARANREHEAPVQIVAITKTFPASAIESAYSAEKPWCKRIDDNWCVYQR